MKPKAINSKYSYKRSDFMPEKPAETQKSIVESSKPKSRLGTTFQLTRFGDEHLTITKSFDSLQNRVVISKQPNTPLYRAPNVINPALPKKCPWDSMPRRNIDFDKENGFRSDLLNRFVSVSSVVPVAASKINLPWMERFWNIFVTNVNGFDDISARLIGHQYSVSRIFFSFFFPVYLKCL